jgi:CheY-like chemotaxis protein
VTHTLDVGPDAFSVALDDPLEMGAGVRVALSFPRLVEEFAVDARVVERLAPEGFGEPPAFRLEILHMSETARERLTEVLAMDAHLARESGRMRTLPKQDGYRFLLVEDNAFIRDLFAYAMHKYFRNRRADVRLGMAADGEEAWRMLGEETYDMAIVDYYLPVLSGSQLIERMRAEPRYATLPVVAISVGGPDAREATLCAGADIFLDKPIVIRDLFSTLDRLTLKTDLRAVGESTV